MEARIHSIETCGTMDGPGLRYVVFMQGCLLRCQYCHNPDTWAIGKGRKVTSDQILEDLLPYEPYFRATGGGITISGGEPLLHIDFLIDLFKKCKAHNIHTAIDSSGGCFRNEYHYIEKLEPLLELTDLVLLDLKQIDDEKHQALTTHTNQNILQFARLLSNRGIPVWIRHVLVPGLTDDPQDLNDLHEFIQTLNNVHKVEILPFHKLGEYKWKALGLPYQLTNTRVPSDEQVLQAKSILGIA